MITHKMPVDDSTWVAASLIRRLMKQVWLCEASKQEGLRSALGEAQYAAYMQSHLTGRYPVYAEGVKWLDEHRDS